ncbi:MAG: segregation/condensation protein A [Anaerolineae bacterium]|nr:segregation/condensation protein A [Gemmatimonadaceae bacterium]
MGLLAATGVAADSSCFVVDLDQFNGPLDLLLILIREEEVEIADIPIARIAEQFLERVHGLGLSAAAEYLEMAARLLRIKAQMLLPQRDAGDDWQDPRAELVRRLLEYQQMREVADVLEKLSEQRRSQFRSGCVSPERAETAPALQLSLAELLAAADRVIRMVRHPGVHDVIPRALDVDGAMLTIRNLMARSPLLRWVDLISWNAESWEVLSALLALLELARRGELRLRQTRSFGPLEILRDAASEAA